MDMFQWNRLAGINLPQFIDGLKRSIFCLLFFISGLLASCTFDMSVNEGGSAKAPNKNPSSPVTEKPTLCDNYQFQTNPTQIFRSVGPNNSEPLALGHANALTISDSRAEFATGLIENIGVGDVIEYDSDNDGSVDSLAFIYCRGSDQVFLVRDENGNSPSPANLDLDWRVYRAYTAFGNTNTGFHNQKIQVPFDNWGGTGKNLVTDDQQWNLSCYGDNVDDIAGINYSNWTTDANHLLKLYAPQFPNEVGRSQRHIGTWTQGACTINERIIMGVDHAWVDGLQFEVDITALDFDNVTGPDVLALASNNIVKGDPAYGISNAGIGLGSSLTSTGTAYIWNNLVYNRGTAGAAIGQSGSGWTSYIFNNTLVNNDDGVHFFQGAMEVRNNISYNNNDNYIWFGPSFLPASDNNLSGPVQTDGPGANSQNGVTLNFLDPTNEDFRLRSDDNVAIAQAASIPEIPGLIINQDLDGTPRGVDWDIGADQFASSATLDVQPKYPTNGANWNDYVQSVDNDTACLGSTDTGCLHGGELRVVDLPSTYTRCDGLFLWDALNAFNWQCVETNGSVRFESTGLKAKKGLIHLVDTGAFKNNYVTLWQDGEVLEQSAPAPWWTNAFAALPDNSATPTLVLDGLDDDGPGGPDEVYSEGTIFYLASSRTSEGYLLDLNKASLVTINEATLTHTGSGIDNCTAGAVPGANFICLVGMGSDDFQWIEGNFAAGSGTPAQFGILRYNTNYAQARNIRLNGFSLYGMGENNVHYGQARHIQINCNGGLYGLFYLNTPNNTTVYDVETFDCATNGVDISGLDHRLDQIRSHHNGSTGLSIHGSGTANVRATNVFTSFNNNYGIRITDPATRIVLSNFTTSNNNLYGIYVDTSQDNTITSGLITNNGDSGIYTDLAVRNTYSHLTLANNLNNNLYIFNSSSFSAATQILSTNTAYAVRIHGNEFNFQLAQIAATNSSEGIYIITNANDATFKQNLYVGNNSSADCSVFGTGHNLVEVTGNCTTNDPELMIQTGIDLSTSLGLQATSDPLNNDSTSLDGSGFIPETNITDPFGFISPWISWGVGATAGDAFATNNRGSCSGNSCGAWDWRLLSTDSVLKNSNGSFTPDQPCPASVHGDVVTTDYQTTPNIYLTNAQEILSDSLGDNDGLCESSEACVFSPHIGAFQGKGHYTLQSTCHFQNGMVSDVILYGHPY